MRNIIMPVVQLIALILYVIVVFLHHLFNIIWYFRFDKKVQGKFYEKAGDFIFNLNI